MLKINRKIGILGLTVWWALFVFLSITNTGNVAVLNTLSFISLLVVPGFLTLLAFELEHFEEFAVICLIVAFSLLEILFVGLLSNTILPFYGLVRPLEKIYILEGLTFLVTILAGIGLFRKHEIEFKLRHLSLFENIQELLFLSVPLIFVFQAVVGAFMLNNGGSNVMTLFMLGEMAIYIVILYIRAEKLDDRVLPISLFLMSLAVLLMTSMRGWYITGHDIQLEYKVFQLAKNAEYWTMSVYRDAYNACLSITILPTIFSNFITVADQYIFKFFFQIIFALTAGIVYLISRNWLSKRMSFLAGVYFIAFPTFFEDMPFLIRQEIAFLFYGLMIYLIFKENINLQVRRILFVVMGVGVILSHYSTTYTVLFIFGLTAISFPLFKLFTRRSQKNLGARNSALDITRPQKAKITVFMVGILIALNFLWTTTITNTGGNIIKVVGETIVAAKDGFLENGRSVDAISLITFRKPDLSQQMADYVDNVVNPARSSSQGSYLNLPLFFASSLKPLAEEKLPLSQLGQFLTSHKINIQKITLLLGELIAKLMEIAAPVGMFYLFWRNKVLKSISGEFFLIGLFYLLFIAANIVLPILSTQYGVFRAIQQALFVIAPLVVIGSSLIESKRLPIIMAVLFFVYSTAFFPQLIGGNEPQLHLNNSGNYYENFLMHKTEISGMSWLYMNFSNLGTTGKNQPELQADKFMQSKIISITNLKPTQDGIFPLLLKSNSYVFLGWSNVKQQIAPLTINDDAVMYSYPIEVLDRNKDLIYNNGGAKIYK